MQWTTSFPKSPGWYWLRRPDFGDEIVKVEDSEEEMTKLNRAYEVLSDEELKKKYDKYLKVD